jgi:hypothetical protein
MDLKKCCSCKEKKHPSEFNRHRGTKDGLQGKCRECGRKQSAAWRAQYPDRQAALTARWEAANRDRVAAQFKRMREKHPEKFKARMDLNNAVYAGKVHKPDACERCGKKCTRRALHGHHHDYSKPFEVDWLCQGCHVAEHKGRATP